jgi:hypothetical protein
MSTSCEFKKCITSILETLQNIIIVDINLNCPNATNCKGKLTLDETQTLITLCKAKLQYDAIDMYPINKTNKLINNIYTISINTVNNIIYFISICISILIFLTASILFLAIAYYEWLWIFFLIFLFIFIILIIVIYVGLNSIVTNSYNQIIKYKNIIQNELLTLITNNIKSSICSACCDTSSNSNKSLYISNESITL